MFSAIPKAYAIGAAIAAICAVAGWLYYDIRRSAQNDLLQKIERVERKVRENAATGARDVDSCYAAGGVWSRANGACRFDEGQR